MTQIVQKALDLLRPHRSHRLYPLCFVSETTRTSSKRLFDLLQQEEELSVTDLEDIKKIIEDNPRADVFHVVNWDGYTLLQKAVVGNHLTVVKMLLKKGCDVNVGICSLPLHLACKLGHVHVAQLLLTYGAKADIECTVCYPEEHKLKTYPDQIYCLAYQPVYTPVMYSLNGDHEQILRLLLHHEHSRQQVKTDFLLHEACKMGAQECSRYLLQRYSEQMSQENTDGKTPLQISLVMDAESAMFLRDNGAELKDTVFLTDSGSTLHEMYRAKKTLGLVKATKFALEHGFRSHINVRDSEGNTALYVLLRHVGRTVKSSMQSDYDTEVETCIKMLLVHGANPNIVNYCGETALHSVLCDTSARKLYVNRHGTVQRLKPTLQEICKIVNLLLVHGADAGHRPCPAFIPPLYYAIRIFESLQTDMFVVVKNALKQLLICLCQENCNLNACDSYGLTPTLHLLNASYSMISKNTSNVTFCKTILPFVGEMLQHFLKQGLDANAQVLYWTRRMDEAIDSNYFKEIILFINLQIQEDPSFYEMARQLLIKLVQRGGNPNLLTFTPSYGTPFAVTKKVPRDASLSCLLARSLYVLSDNTLPPVLNIVSFFYHTLTQLKLVEFLESVNHYLTTDFKSNQLPPQAQTHIDAMATRPRTLKEITRVAIAENLDWCLIKKAKKLPLPKSLMEYCIAFDN